MVSARPVKTILDLLFREYGTDFVESENPENIVDIDTAAKVILRRDGSRVGFVFVNLSTTDAMFLRPNRVPTSTLGLRVDSAQTLFVHWKDDGTLPAQEWQAIAASNNQAFILIEYRIP